MSSAEHFKCRFCSWQTLKYKRLPDGRVQSGWTRLRDHIEDSHYERFEEIYCNESDGA